MDLDLLSGIPLLANLSDEQRAELAKFLKTGDFHDQQPIFWIGDPGSDFYILREGRVSISCPDEAGRETVLAVLGPGRFFGEISLLDGGPRTATARAQGAVTVFSLDRAHFQQFLEANPSAAMQIMTVLGQRQREMLDKLRGVRNVNEVLEQSYTLWDRVADFIAAVSASQAFVILHLLFFGVWIIVNIVRGGRGFDQYPFQLLTLVVSLEAIFLSIFVLISQNQQSKKDRIAADLDYQVNLKAHLEVMQLHRKVDRLTAMVSQNPGARADEKVERAGHDVARM